jgi:hypothetical protein
MATNFPKSGANFSPAYQISAIPYLTASIADEVSGVHNSAASPFPTTIEFDYVTKWIEVENTDATNGLRVAFSMTGSFEAGERLPNASTKSANSFGNYFVVATGEKVKYDMRCKQLFLVSNAAASGTPEAGSKSSSFAIRAGLTTIPSSNFPVLTGSISGVSAFDGIG